MTLFTAVIASMLTVWFRPDQSPVYVEHVRNTGGQARIAELARWTTEAARRHGVSRTLLAALAHHESGYRHVESRYGAGILQIHPRHRLARHGMCCTPDVPECVRWGLRAGAAALAESLATCGDEWGALGHYRFGHACVRRERELAILRLRESMLDALCAPDDRERVTVRAECDERRYIEVFDLGNGVGVGGLTVAGRAH